MFLSKSIFVLASSTAAASCKQKKGPPEEWSNCQRKILVHPPEWYAVLQKLHSQSVWNRNLGLKQPSTVRFQTEPMHFIDISSPVDSSHLIVTKTWNSLSAIQWCRSAWCIFSNLYLIWKRLQFYLDVLRSHSRSEFISVLFWRSDCRLTSFNVKQQKQNCQKHGEISSIGSVTSSFCVVYGLKQVSGWYRCFNVMFC